MEEPNFDQMSVSSKVLTSDDEEAVMAFLVNKFESPDMPPIEDNETVASRAKMIFPSNVYKMFMELPDEDSEEEIELRFEEGDIMVETPSAVSHEVNAIAQLVEKVKTLTTLVDLKEEDWNATNTQVITQFLRTSSESLLTIYYDGDNLIARLGIPDIRFEALTYFIRIENMSLKKVEYFNKSILYGTLDQYPEECLLNLLESIYGPIFFRIKDYPPNIKSDLCLTISELLMDMTQLRFNMTGLTGIYIPPEVISKDIQKACKNLMLIKRLDYIILRMFTNIRNAINDVRVMPPEDEPHPLEIFQFWGHRFDNLCSIWHQLKDPLLAHVCKILLAANSNYVKNFLSVIKDVKEAKEEAKCNVCYLKIMYPPCMELYNVVQPAEIPEFIPQVLFAFKVIWLNSPYFNTREQLQYLLFSLSNQIVYVCKKFLDFELVIQRKPRQALKVFKSVLYGCVKYKELYDLACSLHNKDHEKKWNVNTDSVFNQIDTLVQRCRDVIEVCETLIIFGRVDEVSEIPKPEFGWTLAPEYSKRIDKIESRFWEYFKLILEVQDTLLFLYTNDWPAKVIKFRQGIRELELLIENLLESLFQTINNVEEGIEVLQTMYQYSKRVNLYIIFEQYTTNVYEMMLEEILDAKNQLQTDKREHAIRMPRYSGRAVLFYQKKKRITMLYEKLPEAEWMVECNLRSELDVQYSLLSVAYDQEINRLYHRWLSLIPDDIVAKMTNSLLLRSNKVTGLLEVNFDGMLGKIVHEATFWIKLEKQIPIDAHQIYSSAKNLVFIKTSLELITTQYNSIIITLSDTERLLFEALLTQLERQIQPAFTSKFTWTSGNIDLFLNECTLHLNNLKDFIEEYKQCNLEIASYCEKISLINFNKATSGHIYILQQYKNIQQNGLTVGIKKIIEYIDNIALCVKIILEGFEPYLAQMMTSWYTYLIRLDKLIETSILRCATVSMENILGCVRGVASLGPTIVFRIWLYLKNGSIVTEPTCLEFICLAKHTLPNIIMSLRAVERFSGRFNIKVQKKPISYAAVVALDKNLVDIQFNIEKEMATSLNSLRSYTSEWMPFKEIWEVDRQQFLTRYETLDPDSNMFYKDVTRFLLFMDEANDMLPYVNFRLFTVDSKALRDAIIGFCDKWFQGLTNLLLKIVCRKIEGIYRYCDFNIKKLKDLPKNQYALTSSMEFHQKLKSELSNKEKEFPYLKEQIDVLVGFRDDFPPILLERENALSEHWKNYKEALEEQEKILQNCQAEFKTKLLEQGSDFRKSVLELLERFRHFGPFDPSWNTICALKQTRIIWELYLELEDTQKLIMRDLNLFKAAYFEPAEMGILKDELLGIQEVWELTLEWDEAWEGYKYSKFWDIKTEDMENTVQKLFKRLNYLVREYRNKNWPIVEDSKKRVDSFRRVLPLINDLKNKAMRDRHWQAVKNTIGHEFDEMAPTFTLELIMNLKMQDFADDINEISTAATMELNIEKNIKNIEDIWRSIKLDMVPHKVKRMYRLRAVDDVFQTLEDHLAQISTMKGTRYVTPFIEEVNYWEKNLALVMDVLDMSLNVQRSYLYLENIFSGEDIQKQLPKESDDFFKVVQGWTKITHDMHVDRYAFIACRRDGLVKTLNKMILSLEVIQRALEAYLETKRQIFPRFYFISNDDLLEILGNSKKPELIQPHFKKCFDNINKIVMVKQQVIPYSLEGRAMISGDGETVEFKKSVVLEGPVEHWLREIEGMMRISLRDVIKDVKLSLKKMLNKRDKWVRDWPGQLCITSSQIQWTVDCTRTLFVCEQTSRKKPLKRLRKKQNQVLEKFSNAVRSNLSKVDRLKVVALVTIEIHARDVIDKMYKTNTLDTNSFEWLSQLRFYWDRDVDDCIIRQTNTHFAYGYEYLGNSGRLVITPLTDRCYITLTTALHLYRGGSPKGPAGTGKTETVKDLGKGLGYYVIVINCSEGLDYKSMGRMFSGLAQTGAWGCFDEFNRINIEVLSVVAQQILSIISALSQKMTKFKFEGYAINLVPTCGAFITMNPGYAGRTELPDNLKSMFRPISMMVPDCMLIAEITLFGEGFRNTRVLARKADTLFSLCKQQLSKQDHYDFGLRGMVALLRYAGKKRRKHQDLTDDEVLLLAMKDMNIAKLTSDDLPLFNGITRDLFPFVELPVIDYEVMYKVMREVMAIENIQPIPSAMTKVIQLYETKGSRHSVMIVGASGAAKSVTWKTLKSTMITLKQNGVAGFENVQEYPMNPKAVNLGELYGEFNLGTGEWLDGILSSIMRKTCADESSFEKWILFDGPVDAVWIENMNSVMDDNKILTLINSERITMPEQVSLLFEVEDLVVASPATVSRCGMVFNDYKDFTWRPYANSWIAKSKSPLYQKCMDVHFQRYVQAVLDFKRANTDDVVAVPELCQIISLCRLLDCLGPPEKCTPYGAVKNYEESYTFLTKLWFLFCLIWSLGATVNEVGKEKIDQLLREMEGVFPMADTVYEYYVNVRMSAMAHWEEQLKSDWIYNPDMPFYKIIVPTVDTVRYQYLTSALLQHRYPVLLVGVVGTGKTSTAMSVLSTLDDTKYSLLIINMSAQTSSNNIQDTIESRVEKRTKGVYYPIGNKVMVAFMDDFNMPKKETYGAQPPLELIRQWIDYGFWYNRQNQTTTSIRDMLLMSSMGPPGGGRNAISNRLTSRFSVINVAFPADQQIFRIFTSMLSQHLNPFISTVRSMSEGITRMTVQLYKEVVAKMLPTPAKMHYLFNMRDISKIFQGLLRASIDFQNTKQAILRLWVHESFRVFSDRLTDSSDQEWFQEQLNTQLGVNFEVTFNSLCTGRSVPVFCSFMNQYQLYEDVLDMSVLRMYLEKKMDEYNDSAGSSRLNLVLFKEAIEHICRCARVISQPRGHCLLVGIGGIGRQSMARIASYVCDLTLFQIEIKRNYGITEFREDLKLLYTVAGVKDTPSCFLFSDTQVTDESFLEIINNVLSTGEVPNLYKPEEFEEIKEALYNPAKKAGLVPTSEVIYSFLIDRVRSNLHIVITMSYVGDAFRHRLRQYPSLINCTTIDWYVEWPPSALLEVARKFVSDVDMLATITGVPPAHDPKENIMVTKQEKLREAVSTVFSLIHDSVCRYSYRMRCELKRYNYVTPINYLELVAGYKVLLAEKRKLMADQANKLRNGLHKIDETSEKVSEMTVELEKATVEVAQMNKDCDDFLVLLMSQKREADEQQKIVAANSVKIRAEEVECQAMADVALADLQEAMPALEDAMKALEALNKKDLSEIKSYGKPPQKVEMVMEAVMILKKNDPTWAEAKRQLGDVNFLNQLKEFDKDHIPDKVLRKVANYTQNPEFEPEKIGVVSTAAKSLSMWVIAIEKYGKIYRIVAPKKAKVDEAMESLKAKQAMLAEAQAKLEQLHQLIARLKRDYDEKMNTKEELRKKAEMLTKKLDRAAQLLDGLSGEKVRWQITVIQLDSSFDLLLGDVLIATAFLSYMGPFVSQYREQLLAEWFKFIKDAELPYSEEFRVDEFLADAAAIREWNIQGLPTDSFSSENGIIVTRGTRWPLIVDPQCQGWKWIRNKEMSNGLKVVDFGVPNYMKIIEMAMASGNPVLLQNISEVIDPSIIPVLQKSIILKGTKYYIKIGDRLAEYSFNFRFFITTKLGNPHYPPEICTLTTIVNFAIKDEGLQAQLLGLVVREDKPRLEQIKDSLVVNIATGKRTLKELEDELLRVLNESEGSLLDNDELFNTLKTSKATAISVNEQLEVSITTEVEIDSVREGYRPCAQRASILFFVLNDMSRIDPMYQWSLDSYNDIFVNSIRKSKKSDDIEERLMSLNETHTYSVYRNICRGLFEKHKLLFSFYMCIQILTYRGEIQIYEYQFLLKGGVVLNRDEQMENPCSWMPEEAWDNITELDKVHGFHGVTKIFEQFPKEWKDWYFSTSPESLELIGEWENKCTQFQRMLFIRSLRPDRLSFSISNFVADQLGQKYTEPPVLDVKGVLEDSSNKTPLIFVLSPGVDPTGQLLSLADSSKMSTRFKTLSLGQGQAPYATRMIEQGVIHGHWVFLANCHLSLSWMPALDKIIEVLQTSKETHPDFRLWLSSSPHPDFPISILQSAIKMTTEPPKGVKANMKRLYNLISPAQFGACKMALKYRKLLFSLCFFHSVLLERKKFQQLGWNVIYSFNDSDFEVSENILALYLDEYKETPWDALKYLIAGICYGGHVTDDWDRRLLLTYINTYFNNDAINVTYFKVSSLPYYYIPEGTTLGVFQDFVAALPQVDNPALFGQHPNADITSLMIDTRVLCETLMSLNVQEDSSGTVTKEDQVMQLSLDILTKVPRPIDYETTYKNIGPNKSPLDVVLLQEIIRYNTLLVSMIDSLKDLQKGIKGLVVMSSVLEDIFVCIFEARVPPLWLKAYHTLKTLGAWTRDLIQRVEHFNRWAETVRPPVLFWLASFTFPTGFLTAVLQKHARENQVSVDTLSWEFTPQGRPDNEIIIPSAEGVFIRSLYLEGAGWNNKLLCLAEPGSMQLVAPLPVILFKPCEISKKKAKGLYQCPVYYYPIRTGPQGRESFIIAVDLKSGDESPDHWVKRATAILLSLSS